MSAEIKRFDRLSALTVALVVLAVYAVQLAASELLRDRIMHALISLAWIAPLLFAAVALPA